MSEGESQQKKGSVLVWSNCHGTQTGKAVDFTRCPGGVQWDGEYEVLTVLTEKLIMNFGNFSRQTFLFVN